MTDQQQPETRGRPGVTDGSGSHPIYDEMISGALGAVLRGPAGA
jgi:hypothetical protein